MRVGVNALVRSFGTMAAQLPSLARARALRGGLEFVELDEAIGTCKVIADVCARATSDAEVYRVVLDGLPPIVARHAAGRSPTDVERLRSALQSVCSAAEHAITKNQQSAFLLAIDKALPDLSKASDPVDNATAALSALTLENSPPVGVPLPPEAVPHTTQWLDGAYVAHRLTDRDYSAREMVRQDLSRLVNRILLGQAPRYSNGPGEMDGLGPGLRVALFGSSSNGLGATHSDVDAVVLALSPAVKDALCSPGRPKAAFIKLRDRVLYSRGGTPGFGKWTALSHARVPILRTQHLQTGLEIDLSMWQELPEHNTMLLRAYTMLHPCVAPFVMAIKQWAKLRGVSSAPDGTPSAYCWAILSLFFLQRCGLIPSLQDRAVIDAVCHAAHDTRTRAPPVVESHMCQGWPVLYVHGPTLSFLLQRTLFAWGTCPVGPEAVGVRSSMPRDPRVITTGHLLTGFFAYWDSAHVRSLGAASVRTASFVPRSSFQSAKPLGGESEAGKHVDSEGATPGPEVGEASPSPASSATSTWRLAVEDPFELDHDLGRVLRPYGQAWLEDELARAVAWTRDLAKELGQPGHGGQAMVGLGAGRPASAWSPARPRALSPGELVSSRLSSLFRQASGEEVDAMARQASFKDRLKRYSDGVARDKASSGQSAKVSVRAALALARSGHAADGSIVTLQHIRTLADRSDARTVAALPPDHPVRQLWELRTYLREYQQEGEGEPQGEAGQPEVSSAAEASSCSAQTGPGGAVSGAQ